MFSRLLFLLLLALNLGAGAWLLFGHTPVAPLPPLTDPGVPMLRLLSEQQPQMRSVVPTTSVSALTSTSAQLVRDVCHTLGPFTSAAGMRAAMSVLSPHVARIQYRKQNVRRSHGFWVYLPATASREAALDEARQLQGKGIQNYYVVTAGDQQNTISLGLFNDPANARNRLEKLQKLGFPVKVRQRVDTETDYWLDFAVPVGSTFNWTVWLPGRDDLKAKSIQCF